eukprot:TRINITY_DN11770_c0_g1_i1.p1 TRINITY_DN11770_c0_g1~~TRINITY_DN11770_c0_g1_i1.p1  ORF type:complete len:198 (-),score=39.71 TRINITY_DN11770_c0_g1_i1:327-920(-)
MCIRDRYQRRVRGIWRDNMAPNRRSNRPRNSRNVHNLGVDVSSIQTEAPAWFGAKRPSTWSPCTGLTPTTPQAPSSPFVHACWHDLNDEQKEQTAGLDEHLVNASWILLRRRASCLFTARAVRQADCEARHSKLMAEVVARKEKEIEAIMKQEGNDAVSPRRTLPRRFVNPIVSTGLHKRQCMAPGSPCRSPIRTCA